MSRWLRGLVAFVLTLGTGEAAVRMIDPSPRTQVISANRRGIVTRPDGLPTWRRPGAFTETLENAGCVGDRHVVMAGDSILYVVGDNQAHLEPEGDATSAEAVEAQRNVAVLLQGMLRDLRPSVCLHNVAQPGFTVDQIGPVVETWAARTRAEVVVLGVWKSERRMERLGDAWYDLTPYVLPEGAWPSPLGLPVPDALGRAVFGVSHLYRIASLVTHPLSMEEDRYGAWLTLARRLREAGHEVVMVEHTALPALRGTGKGVRASGLRDLERAAVEDGFLYLALADAWADRDVAAMALDVVHLKPEGHQLLAETLAPWIVRALGQHRAAAPD